MLSAQTIGVEFSSKIVKIGTGARRKRVKLQLWDTAGTERFRSVSRSYYRGAAGAILVYDIASHASFAALPTFLMDARALASPNLTVLLAGNKSDLTTEHVEDLSRASPTPSSISSKKSSFPFDSGKGSIRSMTGPSKATKVIGNVEAEGREVSPDEASRWASKSNVPVAVEVSALSGENVDEIFSRLARIILTKIELGEIDPDDPQSGIQYGDNGTWGFGASDGGSIRSGMTIDDNNVQPRMRKPGRRAGGNAWVSGMREWEDVFKLGGPNRMRSKGCC